MKRQSKDTRKILVIEYDVTGLTAKQIDRLAQEAIVQGQASDDGEADAHPDVPAIATIITPGRKS